MRISSRTGLVALLAATLAVLCATAAAGFVFQRALYERVDQQLRERAPTAPVLVAVGDRVALSELNATIEGARVMTSEGEVVVGRWPASPVLPSEEAGLRTVSTGGEQWRLLTVVVEDVPTAGDKALVELAAPLGDVRTRARRLRRQTNGIGVFVALFSGLIGLLLGRKVTEPLSRLRADAAHIGTGRQEDWSVQASYGPVEVDELATALNESLDRLRQESTRRQVALDSARLFAAAASHELRTPLQGAMTQLDLALTTTDDVESPAIAAARSQLDRMAAALSAVRALTEVDLLDSSWFGPADLSDIADLAVAGISAAERGATSIVFAGDEEVPVVVWADGARLAIENVIRNALVHGQPTDGSSGRVVVWIDGREQTVVVDDDGPGIDPAHRQRLLQPFERGEATAAGSGLGLAFAHRVTVAHGGRLEIDDAPHGGTRVILQFSPAATLDKRTSARVSPVEAGSGAADPACL